MTTKTETQHQRLELAEARAMVHDLKMAERKRKLPHRVRRLWLRSIRRHLDRAAGNEPIGGREYTTMPEGAER